LSLHYLVKLEMLIAHVLPLNRYRKKLQKFIAPQLWHKLARFESSWYQRVRNIAEKVYETRTCITGLELLTTPLTNGWRHDPAWPTPFSVAVSVVQIS